jgi:hypothetical protein
MIKQTVIALFGIVAITSCSNHSSFSTDLQEEYQSTSSIEETQEIANQDEIKEITFIPDLFIGEISLLNANNVEKYLGPKSMDRLTKLGDDIDFPNLKVLSSDKKQTLTVYFHPGGLNNEFSEFKVAVNRDKETNFLQVRTVNISKD